MYADDTSLSSASNNIDDLHRFMNEDLNCLKDWLQGNKLSLNVLKTHAMVVGSRPKLKRIADEISGQSSFLYGDVAAKLNLITYKNCKIELPELLLIAAFVFQQLI